MKTRWWFVAVCAVALLAYVRTFTSPFQFDDYGHVVDSPALEEPSLDVFLGFARARVLPFATLMLNHWLGGEDPFSYHVVNFAIHLLAAFAVFQLVLDLCRTPRLRDERVATQALPLALVAALVFACHPIQIQAVTYIVQRISSMAALFYVGSVCFYVRARNAQLGSRSGTPAWAFAGSHLCALAAFLSKENSASLPVTIALTEWTFYPKTGRARGTWALVPFLALLLLVPLIWWRFGSGPTAAPPSDAPLAEQAQYLLRLLTFRAHPHGHTTPLQYFLTQCTVIPRYLGLVVLPWGFNIDHDVPRAETLSLAVTAGLIFLIALLAFGIFALRRWPLIGFGVVWLFLALSVESSFLPIQDYMVEHRMYLAMPGVAMVIATVFAWTLQRHRVPALLAGAAMITALCTLTFMRNELWRRPLWLWQDAQTKSPNKARVYANIGTALHEEGKLDHAIAYYCRALALDPTSETAEINIEAALDEQMESDEGDGPIMFEGPSGQPAEIELTRPHPCPPKGRR